MRILQNVETRLVAGGVRTGGLEVSPDMIKLPGEGGPNDTVHERQVKAVTTGFLAEAEAATYGGDLVSSAMFITDLAELSAHMADVTYADMHEACTLWEDNGNVDGSPVPYQIGSAFDVNMINWSAYDDGGSLTCDQAIANLQTSVFTNHQAVSINPAWAEAHGK